MQRFCESLAAVLFRNEGLTNLLFYKQSHAGRQLIQFKYTGIPNAPKHGRHAFVDDISTCIKGLMTINACMSKCNAPDIKNHCLFTIDKGM